MPQSETQSRQRASAQDRELVLVVSLWLRGDVPAFEAFERDAARVMARHGGYIRTAVRVTGTPALTDPPFEIHVVTFPDEHAFAAYQADADVAALTARRDSVVARTEICSGSYAGPY